MSQAISWFAQGCRHGSMLWQKLQREMPTTLADTIKIADMYALGDPMQPTIAAEPVVRTNVGTGSYQPRPVQDFRKRNAPDYRYGSNQVAAVEQDQQAAGSSQRPRFDGQQQWNSGPKQWPPRNDYPRRQFDGPRVWQNREKFTYDQMLDRPCSHHSQLLGKPSDHTNRQCAWNVRMSRGDGMAPPAPRPPPLTGPNAIPLPPPPAQAPPQNAQQANVNVVEGQGQGGRREYQDHQVTYVVFVT